MAHARITMSLTETNQFRRLVDFAAAVERHADEQCDVALQALVHDLHDDLLRLRGDTPDAA